MFRGFVVCCSVLLAGCADKILSDKEKDVFAGKQELLLPKAPASLAETSDLSKRLSAAYFEAARQAQKIQDGASAAIILAGASAVAGAASGVSDRAIANRALGAVGIQQAASRGVSRATIQSLYDGAQILNCIGVVASIYENDAALNSDDKMKAVDVTIGVIREVRINARRGLTREVAEYSSVVSAFNAVIEGDQGAKLLGKGQIRARGSTATPEQLEVYLARLGGCTEHKKVSDSASPPS